MCTFRINNLKFLNFTSFAAGLKINQNQNSEKRVDYKMKNLCEVETALISQIARKFGFRKFVIHAKAATQKGDNYLGIITTVTIEEGGNEQNLILKTAHSCEKFRSIMKIPSIFVREVYVYETLFPLIDDLQNDLDVRYPFRAHTNSLGSHIGGNFECFVMVDLRRKNFMLWNRKIPMNPGHLDSIIREYAKLHSIGMIMKAKKPDLFKEIEINMVDVWSTELDNEDYLERLQKAAERIVSKMSGVIENNPEAAKVLQVLSPDVLYNYWKVHVHRPEFRVTIVHGDCWCNNMMFKYKDPENKTKPDEICFLDWQLSKVGSPAVDLVYYLFTSADVEELRNYRHYLKIYYQTLSENLISVGLDPEEIFPFSMLEDHFKQFSLFGLMTAVMILQLIILDKEEAPDLSKMDDDFKEMFNMVGTNQQVYRDRILNLILFLADNELL